MKLLDVHVLLRTASVLAAASAVAFALGRFHYLLPGLLCLMALLFGAGCMDRIEAGDHPAFERDWGGLGMEPAGWRLSPALAYLVAASVFGMLSVAALSLVVGSAPAPKVAGPGGASELSGPRGAHRDAAPVPGPPGKHAPDAAAPPAGSHETTKR